MASKRALKKSINGLTSELLNECFAFSYFHPDTNPKKVTETMWALAHTRNELIARINRDIDTMSKNQQSPRRFYQALIKDAAQMPDLIEHFTKK